MFGVEGDVDGADSQHTASPFGGLTAGDTVATRSDIKGSIRARLGVGVNRALFYATGGAAFAGEHVEPAPLAQDLRPFEREALNDPVLRNRPAMID